MMTMEPGFLEVQNEIIQIQLLSVTEIPMIIHFIPIVPNMMKLVEQLPLKLMMTMTKTAANPPAKKKEILYG